MGAAKSTASQKLLCLLGGSREMDLSSARRGRGIVGSRIPKPVSPLRSLVGGERQATEWGGIELLNQEELVVPRTV